MTSNPLLLDQFLLFGDSITEFAYNTEYKALQDPKLYNNGVINPMHQQFALGSALNNIYVRKLDVLPKGFSGYNSRWALSILPKLLEIYKNIKMAYIFFGSNDSCLGERQHVPLDEYEENVKKLIEIFKQNGIDKILLVTPALFNAELWNKEKKEEVSLGYTRSNPDFKKYGSCLHKVGSEYGLPVVDLHEAFKEYADKELAGNWEQLLCDGLHFSGLGYFVFYNELIKKISESYPEMAPNNVAYNLPNWRNVSIDGSNLYDTNN